MYGFVSKLALPNIKKFVTAVIRMATLGEERSCLMHDGIRKHVIIPINKHINIPVVHVTWLQIIIENKRKIIRENLKNMFFRLFSLFMQKSNAVIKQCK